MSFPKHAPILIFIAILPLIAPGTAYAQTETDVARSGIVDLRTSQNLFAVSPARGVSLRQYLATTNVEREMEPNRTGASAHQASSEGRRRSVGRKILGGALGGVAGFFGGGYLGAAIEGDRCHCDDPGLMGALIGAPVGATVGAILGVMFF